MLEDRAGTCAARSVADNAVLQLDATLATHAPPIRTVSERLLGSTIFRGATAQRAVRAAGGKLPSGIRHGVC